MIMMNGKKTSEGLGKKLMTSGKEINEGVGKKLILGWKETYNRWERK